MDIPLALAIWLHTVALVIAWGYYGILGRVMLPAFARSLDGPAGTKALLAIEHRALPLVLLSAVLFTVTGTYLLLVDPHYAGLGNFFASTWTVLMLAKHGFVIAFVLLAVLVDRMIRRLNDTSGASEQRAALRRLGLAAEGATALGAFIVLLTAVAQVAA